MFEAERRLETLSIRYLFGWEHSFPIFYFVRSWAVRKPNALFAVQTLSAHFLKAWTISVFQGRTMRLTRPQIPPPPRTPPHPDASLIHLLVCSVHWEPRRTTSDAATSPAPSVRLKVAVARQIFFLLQKQTVKPKAVSIKGSFRFKAAIFLLVVTQPRLNKGTVSNSYKSTMVYSFSSAVDERLTAWSMVLHTWVVFCFFYYFYWK